MNFSLDLIKLCNASRCLTIFNTSNSKFSYQHLKNENVLTMENTIKLFQTYIFLTQESTLDCFFMIPNSYIQLTKLDNERSLYDLIFSSFFGFSLHCLQPVVLLFKRREEHLRLFYFIDPRQLDNQLISSKRTRSSISHTFSHF